MILCKCCPLQQNCETRQNIIEEHRANGVAYLDNISLTTMGLDNDDRCPLNKALQQVKEENDLEVDSG